MIRKRQSDGTTRTEKKKKAKPALARGLGDAVRRLREAAGYSQEDFADAIDLHRTAMSKLERGLSDPKLSSLEQLAKGLGLGVGDLLHAAEREPERASPGAK